MKRNTKRLPALLLAILLCLSLLPGTAGAADPTTLIVGNTTVVESGTVGETTSGAGWSYEDGTLTLNGATIATAYTDGSSGKTYGIYADGDLNLVLENASTVQNTTTAFNYGVYVEGDLTVSGTGSLTAGGTDYGVYVANAMTANSGTITGSNTSTSDDDYGDGIYVGNTLTVAGGTVNGSGKSKTSKLNGAGIHVYAGGLTVTSGSVTGTATGERSEGVYVNQGNLAVSGSGSVTGSGSGQWCQGIRLEKGNLEVSGGTVTGTANDANGQGYGIYMYYGCNLNVTGGTVTGNGCGQSGYGIIVENKMTVEGGTVTGTCSDLYGTGIGAAQGLTVSGGSVTGSGQSGYGIRAYNGDIRITGTGTYVEGTSQIPEYAIYVGTKYALYVNDVRYEPSSVTEFKVENGQVTGAIKWTGSGNVWVNGVKITGDPDYTVTCGGDGKAIYAPDTRTLTLTNAAINASYEDVDGTYGIYAEGDLILVLEGSSTVESSDEAFDCSVCIGGDLTVKGGGTLTVNGSGCGIYASNMTVESGSVTGTSTGSNSYGIGVRNVLTVQGGSVTGTSTGSGSYGIDVFKDALTVSGGTVTGTGKKAGIYLEENALKVSGGTVTGEGTNYGIYVEKGSLTVSGSGSVSGTATGYEGTGIYTKYSLTANGGTVTGTAAGDYGVGISLYALTVEGGTVTGTSSSKGGAGIYTTDSLSVKAGRVTGTAEGEGGWGLYTDGSLKFAGGTVNGKGSEAAIVAYVKGDHTADKLIVVPEGYVLEGHEVQTVALQDEDGTYTLASFVKTGDTLEYDQETYTFTNAAKEITLTAPNQPGTDPGGEEPGTDPGDDQPGTDPGQPGTPVTPADPGTSGSSSSGGDDSGHAVSVPASSSVRGGAVSVSPRSAGKGDTVTITVKPDSGYELDELTVTDSKGSELALTSRGSDRYTFTMPASRVNIQVSFKPIGTAPANPFTDVSTGAYYCDAVLWAMENGITNGTTATAFSPDATVTRAQMVTFLWRAHGAPRADGGNPFTDVSSNAYYYDAVLWAVASGITNGTTATTFSPDAPVTRAQAVTFQWRTAGSPAMTGGSFGDVAADAYYAGAVTWAVADGITNGTTAATFSPDTPVSRAQAVTFLYRELA